MSNLQDAVKRRREDTYEHPRNLHQYTRKDEDAGILADAFLALHPADDEPVTEEQRVIRDLAPWASAAMDEDGVCYELKAIFARVCELDSTDEPDEEGTNDE